MLLGQAGNTGGFPVVEAFGSFIMNIFTAKSDLDLSINFNGNNETCFPRDQAIFVLQRLTKVLYKKQRKGHLSGVLPVLQARVPVLKAVDCNTGIECDISVENKAGMSRSIFFSIIASIDERFRIMSYLMKAWAKANDINSSKDHTMNSLTIISLVAFHFQTRDPPILPPFSTFLRGGTDIANLRNVVLAFKNFGDRNKESLAELFVALLAKLSSVEKLWKDGLCASIFEGSWISKTWGSKVGNMSIEDFLDRSQNFARSVGKFEMTKIYDCLRGSLELLSHSVKGQIDSSALRSVLFGSICFDAQSNKAAMIMKQKLPIQSVQSIVDVIDKGNHAKRRKQTFSESAQAHVDTIATTNHANANRTMTLKRKLPSYEPLDPLAHAVAPSNHPHSNSMYNLEQKHPTIEFSQRHIKMISPKRACYAKPAAAASSFGSHQNQSTIYLPSPVTYPTLLNVPPQPIGLAGHPHISFDWSGHPYYRDSQRPIYATMGHRSHHDHLIYPAHHHPVQPAYGSQGHQYFQNPPHRNSTGNPQYLVPSNWFG